MYVHVYIYITYIYIYVYHIYMCLSYIYMCVCLLYIYIITLENVQGLLPLDVEGKKLMMKLVDI
jgi:hypothetical protein